MTEEKKKSKFGRGCLIVLGIFVILVVIGAIAGGDGAKEGKKEAAPAAESKPARAVTAREIAKAYDANEAAAQKEYGGQKLAVTGTVAGVDLGLMDEPIIKLEGINQFMPVQASFDKSFTDRSAQLAKGQKVTVTCEKLGEVAGFAMLDDCTM